MEFGYSYWRSGMAIFVVVALGIFLYIYDTERAGFITWLFLMMPMLPFFIASLFWARNQKRRDKIRKMNLKQKRAYKLKKIDKKWKSSTKKSYLKVT